MVRKYRYDPENPDNSTRAITAAVATAFSKLQMSAAFSQYIFSILISLQFSPHNNTYQASTYTKNKHHKCRPGTLTKTKKHI